MTTPLSKADTKHIASVLNAAAEVVTMAYGANGVGILTDSMLDSLTMVRDDMGRFLAFFEDGLGYGWAKPSALAEMRNIEMMASNLIDHHAGQSQAGA